MVLDEKIRGKCRLLNAELLCEPESKNSKHWWLRKIFDLNLSVWRHFPITLVLLYNDVVEHAWTIAYFSARHSMHALARGCYGVLRVTIFHRSWGLFPLLLSRHNAFESSVALLFLGI